MDLKVKSSLLYICIVHFKSSHMYCECVCECTWRCYSVTYMYSVHSSVPFVWSKNKVMALPGNLFTNSLLLTIHYSFFLKTLASSGINVMSNLWLMYIYNHQCNAIHSTPVCVSVKISLVHLPVAEHATQNVSVAPQYICLFFVFIRQSPQKWTKTSKLHTQLKQTEESGELSRITKS